MDISDAAHSRVQDETSGPLTELNRIVRSAVAYAGAESGALLTVVMDNATQQLSLKIAAVSSAEASPGVSHDGLVQIVQVVIREGFLIRGGSVPRSPADANNLDTPTSLALPVRRDGEVVAALYVETTEPGFAYTDEVVRGLALLTLGLGDSIELKAHIDGATGAADNSSLRGASLVQASPSGINLGDYVVHTLAEMIAIDFGDSLSAAAAHAFAGLQWLSQDPPQLERARSSLSKIASATTVTADILRNYRSQSIASDREFHNISESIGNALELVNAARPSGSVASELQFEEPIMVYAQKRLLEQAFANIMSVLIDGQKCLSPPPFLFIRCRPEDEWLTLAFSDRFLDGSGLKPREFSDPIYQYKEREGGIKLAVANTLIRLHDGTIDVGGTASSGTTVLVKLPRRMSAR